MYSGAGKNSRRPRRHFRWKFAIRYADLRSITVGSVPGRTDLLRNRSRKRLQRRRLQTAYAGNFVYGRCLPQRNAGSRFRRAIKPFYQDSAASEKSEAAFALVQFWEQTRTKQCPNMFF